MCDIYLLIRGYAARLRYISPCNSAIILLEFFSEILSKAWEIIVSFSRSTKNSRWLLRHRRACYFEGSWSRPRHFSRAEALIKFHPVLWRDLFHSRRLLHCVGLEVRWFTHKSTHIEETQRFFYLITKSLLFLFYYFFYITEQRFLSIDRKKSSRNIC